MTTPSSISVMYHYVRDTERTPFPAIKALSVADFERQLDWMTGHFDIVDFPTFEDFLLRKVEPKKPCALLTFDDGFIDHAETVFPILKRRGISGIFFVCDAVLREEPVLLNVHKIHFLLARLGAVAFEQAVRRELENVRRAGALEKRDRAGIYRYDNRQDLDIKRLLNYELPFEIADTLLDRLFREHLGDPVAFARKLYLSPAMISAMAKGGMTFGGHTTSHRVLSRIPADAQRRELAKGVEILRRLTSQTSIPFCYPYGHGHTYNQGSIAALEELGYGPSFTAMRGSISFRSCAVHEIPRYDTKDLPPFSSIP